MDMIEAMYADWATGRGEGGDHWGDVTAEPRGVDYLEVSVNGVPAMWLNPHGAAADRAIVAVHGGGYVGGSIYSHRKMYAHLAKAAGVRVLLTTYRLVPAQWPAPVEDVTAAFRWVRDQGFRTALTGDSAGGGLAVQVALSEPGCAALLLISPWLDLDPAQTSSTYEANAATDLFFTREMVRGLIAAYLPEGVSGVDPEVNPLFADLSGLPPMYVQVGGAESGLGDSERLAALAEKAGVETRLDVFPGKLHSFQMAAGYEPVADDAIGRFAAWVRPKLAH